MTDWTGLPPTGTPAAPGAVARLAQAAAWLLYATLLRLATPLYLARLWWRGAREPAYRQHLGERLGVYRDPPSVPGRVWVHAVSLGETRAAVPLLDALRRQAPGMQLLLTHGTATGRMAGMQVLDNGDRQAWLPYDTPGAVRRFLRHWQPAVGVLMETELWPTLVREAQRDGLPMVMANARLSERSARKGRRLAALLHPAARRLALVLAQSVDDALRLRAAGARPVMVSGNLKFDMTPDAALAARGLQWRSLLPRAVVLAASTREGEEPPLLAAWRAVPAPRPLLAPGIDVHAVSPDGRWLAAIENQPDGSLRAASLYPLDGGPPRPLPGLRPDESPLQLGADGRSVYVHSPSEKTGEPHAIHQIDLETGARQLWRTLQPSDSVGPSRINLIAVSRDGSAAAYSFRTQLSELYLVDGLS